MAFARDAKLIDPLNVFSAVIAVDRGAVRPSGVLVVISGCGNSVGSINGAYCFRPEGAAGPAGAAPPDTPA